MAFAGEQVVRRAKHSFWRVALCAAVAFYAAAAAANEPGPLQPPDRSSPRDTIAGFLADMDVVVEEIIAGRTQMRGADEEIERALDAMDFRTTPDGNTWLVRTERALMLMDVLDRIGLPPLEEIPGDETVVSESLEVWHVPGSPIRVRKIARVGRDSEFLFAPETVERIDRYHRATRQLPSRRGLPLLVDAWLADDTADTTMSRIIRSRLTRIDTESPRATLEGFQDSVNRAFAIVQETEAALRDNPPTVTREEALEAERLASRYLKRAASTLDLSEVPPANREDVGLETALQLKEIMDRLVLPPFEAIPGEIRVREWARAGESTTWLYPNTEIEIAQIQEGENKGHFLFSAKSVRLIPEAYERVKELPYRSDARKVIDVDYLSPGISPGFYHKYTLTPGYLVPGASSLGRLVDALPDWKARVVSGQTLWQWSFLVLAVLLTAGAVVLVFLVAPKLTRRIGQPLRAWLLIFSPVIGAVLVVQTVRFVDTSVNITGDVLTFTQGLGGVLTTALVVWAVFRLAVAVAETVIASPRVPDVGINANLIRIGTRIVAFLAGAWIVIAAVRDLGVELLPLLAGLGVAGLAVSLAAQRTFANMLGGVILYLNRPVRVGDFCLYGSEQMGTVEEIGLLSTRVRTLERSVVTIPNADFSNFAIENLAPRDRRRFNIVLGLRYETSPRQLRYVIAKLRQLLEDHPKVEPEPRVRFTELGEYSLDVEINAYLSCQDQNDYLAIREDLLLQIVDLVAEAGTEFAFPSAVEYQAEATEMDAERGRQAEAQVDRWWTEGRLSRPGFKESRRERSDATAGYLEDPGSQTSVSSELGADDGTPPEK